MIANILSVLAQPQVLVAIVTAVIGPALIVVLEQNRTKKAVRQKVVTETVAKAGQEDPINIGVQALLDWSSKQLGENRTLTEKVKELYRKVNELNLRLAEAEKTIALLKQHNSVLATQVTELGGVPYGFQ